MGVVIKDWRGTKIKIGSKVVYPSRQGSRLWMSEGVVTLIENYFSATDKPMRIGVKKLDGNRVSYPDPQRLTVVE
jgi:hypothetical protein